MRLLGAQLVTDTLAGLAQRAPGPRVAAGNSFTELPARTEAITIPTRHGEIPATVYWPEPSPTAPPVYLNFHGGGWVVRHPEQDDPLCRYLAAEAGVAVINVDYDVAPQRRFPVPVEEAYDAVAWAAGPGHRWDGSRLCVGGQSAGGSLAAAAARLALELGRPAISLQVLHYACLDIATPSRDKRLAGAPVRTGPMDHVFGAAYIPSDAVKRDRLASPAWHSNTGDLTRIAPALLITCALDLLQDEGRVYAGRLAAAGALREHHDLPGAEHNYNQVSRDRALVERGYALIAKHVIAATEV